jgi:phosphatidylserine/phosphatidylglycerophosphate/cardiolipin synthase-like enzyme
MDKVDFPFLTLSYPALTSLITALETGRLSFPVHPATLSAYIPASSVNTIATELNTLYQQGMESQHLTYMLKLAIAERQSIQKQRDRVELVWTGLETPGMESRDTHVVVQELFDRATRSVLISSYALDTDMKGQALFSDLASRMDSIPTLRVRMFLNIKRAFGSQKSDIALIQEFAQIFQQRIWRGNRLPEVFYDPRSLSQAKGPKACLHAKCVIVDEQYLFVTSANFTEAAHERNLEAGILLNDPTAAKGMKLQFERLVQSGQLKSINNLFKSNTSNKPIN